MADANVSRRHDDLDENHPFELGMDGVEYKHRGAWGEMAGCLWLLQNGYEVFRNISNHGFCDIVAIKGDEILKLDVKTSAIDSFGDLKKAQTDQGIKMLAIGRGRNIRILDAIKYIPDRANCAVCGKEFRPQKKGNVRCTPHCQASNRQVRDCKRCGKPFRTTKTAHIFCGNACRQADHKKNKLRLMEQE